MGPFENKRVLQHAFAETAKGNGRPFVAALSEDVAWTIIGSTPWSKTCRGKEAVLRDLLGPLNAQLANRNTITAHRFIAEDDQVVVEGVGHNTIREGKQYNNRCCWVFAWSIGELPKSSSTRTQRSSDPCSSRHWLRAAPSAAVLREPG
jgi:ketosteroid isomerase-like protein